MTLNFILQLKLPFPLHLQWISVSWSPPLAKPPLTYKSLHSSSSSFITQFLVSQTITLSSNSNYGGGNINIGGFFLIKSLGIISNHIPILPAVPPSSVTRFLYSMGIFYFFIPLSKHKSLSLFHFLVKYLSSTSNFVSPIRSSDPKIFGVCKDIVKTEEPGKLQGKS